MSDVKYTRDHEWILMEDDEIGVVGITDYAQEQLGELVFVELPEVDKEIDAGSDAVVIESVKAAGEVKAPVSGTIVEVNETLADEPEKVNSDPMGGGWFIKMRVNDPGELDALMDEDEYKEYTEEL
ncbi:MAG: glycine cleavage system protein GcvH [Gammaproteobacteria bacterium]|nr:glycine cleavage system protein GcvH [Gammaproteobacteria bacterium]NIN37235.1 glycine cleavage system protein GcvH [Gammaproteobacteria bacterium]NIO26093.1 glycine cleavage system protein GcvH [Gammaproteobacteria bacterium]NIO66706.1 glycine cleavage system protein GcvH [Gammaproteobacteria bacterium]NIP46383.1 glycine cleavage system protein GcvH [Gammaproteobacteria bacterium]